MQLKLDGVGCVSKAHMIPKRYWFVFGTFCLSVLLYVDRVCISTAKESIIGDLNLTDKQFGWILSAFALGYAFCQAPAGYLADRLGPRRVLTSVVALWSLFTGLTGAAFGFVSLFIARLLFGAGEAGAFPGIARASFSWIPMSERGLVQGINFSGSRLGAAIALPFIAAMVGSIGWRMSFAVLMVVGFVWAIGWFFWFRDNPEDNPRISPEELEFIQKNRQQISKEESVSNQSLSLSDLLASKNVWLISIQYFCSNFTFFFALTWLYPQLKQDYDLTGVQAGIYAAVPLVFGAIGNWTSGFMIDVLYRKGFWQISRRVPAMIGFSLAAIGMFQSSSADSAFEACCWLSVAIFGADMTLAPSWSFCIDIGHKNAGLVSGTMNMAGNIGSFTTGLAVPYLLDWTGSKVPFYMVASVLSLIAIGVWLIVRPERSVREF